MRNLLSLLLQLPLWVVVSNAFQVAPSSRAVNTAIVAGTPQVQSTALVLASMMNKNNMMLKDDENRESKDLLYAGYRATAVSYVLAGGWAMMKTSGGVNAVSSFYTFLSGPIVAATLSYILSGASQNNRLASATYKRLNLLLIQYGAIGLILAGLLRPPAWYVWACISFVSVINAIEGYGVGVRGWNLEGDMALVRKDLVQQVKNTVQRICFIPSNLQSAEYWLCSVAVSSLAVSNLLVMIQYLVDRRRAYPVTTMARLLSHFPQLVLLAGTCLTLQDAAERGRLQGTTFIQLNFLSAFVFGAMAGRWLFLLLVLCDCAFFAFALGDLVSQHFFLVGVWLSLLSRCSSWFHDTLAGYDCLVFSHHSREWSLGTSL